MVTIAEVRQYLNDLSDEHVTDAVIRIQIRLAEGMVESEKSSYATQQQIENATLAKAGELTYVAFTTEMERGLGILPPVVASHLADLRKISNQFMGYVKRGAPSVITPWDVSDSLWAEEVV